MLNELLDTCLAFVLAVESVVLLRVCAWLLLLDSLRSLARRRRVSLVAAEHLLASAARWAVVGQLWLHALLPLAVLEATRRLAPDVDRCWRADSIVGAAYLGLLGAILLGATAAESSQHVGVEAEDGEA